MIDALTPDDLPDAAALSAGFGWPHRAADWALFLQLGQGLAWREDGGLAGTAIWFPLDDGHAAIGLVQVAPRLQGRRIGAALMQAAIDAAGPRALVLHSTAAGAGLYARLGFAPAGTIDQFQGECRAPPSLSPGIRMAGADDLPAILRLDAQANGAGRAAILQAWARHAAIAVAGADTLTGYAMRHDFGRGQLIGPIVAGSQAQATALADALRQPGFLRLDLPEGSLQHWAAAQGLAPAGQVLAMTRGAWHPPPGPARRHALLTQALG